MTTDAPQRPQGATQLVIGAGEVGTALAQVLRADLRDIEPADHLKSRYDVLHIAYGWHRQFVETTRYYQGLYGADLVVIHSTVPVGTCDPEGWVHSPVRGRHPHMEEGLRTFVKHFGGARAPEAARLWPVPSPDRYALSDLYWGKNVLTTDKAATTELGKLVELAQFGVEVVMNKEIHRLASEHGVPFDEVYGDFGLTYNLGYAELQERRFMKPILQYMEGPIGGHCVSPAIELLGDNWFTQATDGYRSEARAKGVATDVR